MQFKSALLLIAAVSAANAFPSVASSVKGAIVAGKIYAIKDAIEATKAELGSNYEDKARRDLKDSLDELSASVEFISVLTTPVKSAGNARWKLLFGI
ncbi:hypothetical protein GQ53DRAFT_846452 [Thozetella sp. PMI_491]|nr:hypothetical protein GQ53DRAFT_846452 [Thozetella sp. PMI_491]